MGDSPSTKLSAKNNVALVGYRCTGKTVTGKALAEQLSLSFVDTDDLIEKRAGKSIACIFKDDGEPAFRKLEADVVADTCKSEGVIVSLGGGVVMNPKNVENVRQSCFVVLLTADVETILKRMEGDPATAANRPALTDMDKRREVEHLLSARKDAYHAAADIQIDTSDQTIEAVVSEIADSFRSQPTT